MVLFAAAGYWVAHLQAYHLVNSVNFNGPSNPTKQPVVLQTGAWLHNYHAYPWMMIAPILVFAGAITAVLLSAIRLAKTAFIASSLTIFGVITTVGLSMFPFILPSSSVPADSLMVWNASSSQLTLMIMLGATIIFLPLILLYTSWVFWVLRGKVTSASILSSDHAY
jgi:cytochrome d ubiquinol oxidase subunit II